MKKEPLKKLRKAAIAYRKKQEAKAKKEEKKYKKEMAQAKKTGDLERILMVMEKYGKLIRGKKNLKKFDWKTVMTKTPGLKLSECLDKIDSNSLKIEQGL